MSEGKNGPQPNETSHQISRRQFLKAAVATGGVTALTLGGIGLAANEFLRDKRTPDQIETDEGIAKLHEYVGELQDSQIKRDLASYVLPIFSNPKPDAIQTSEGEIPVEGRSLNYELVKGNPGDPQEYNGSLNIIGDPNGENMRAIGGESITFPLPDFLTENEKSGLPDGSVAEDGSFLLNINVEKDGLLSHAISPLIAIKLLDPETHGLDQKEFRQIEKMIYLKEAMGLLYYLKYHEKAAGKVKELGLAETISGVNESGNPVEVNSTTAILSAADRNAGRFLALIDLAGYYLMFNALNDTEIENMLRRDQNFSDALDSIDFYNESYGTDDIYRDATDWSLTSPVVNKLAHTGDLNKLP